ncbi:MAG: LysR family transcriptional regulator [Legionellales bacterium RIFCSPHIGHO2_12_FULL_37_14]|nr:MAG: LysR family transcriptional regulator [Legionellales bacterium RIFCSPHIGHO2_12_FULL_37_14]
MAQQSLQYFETFLCVAELGGFTSAAKALGVSKAAVSHAIRLLEESLRAPLFIRTTRKIALTEEGEILLAQCEKIKQELDIARQLISGFERSPSGKLRISCNPYFAETKLAKLLATYIKKFPKVIFEILSEERMPDMAKENIDIVFGINWPAPPDIVAREIGTTRYVLCASPQYLKKHGKPKVITDLENHHYIQHTGRSKDNRLVNLKNHTIPAIKPYLSINNANLMKHCALQHMGIIQLHDYMIEPELKSGKLVEILASCFKPNIPIYVYYQKHRFVQPKIKQFIQLLIAQYKP